MCTGNIVHLSGNGVIGNATYSGIGLLMCLVQCMVGEGWVGYNTVTNENSVSWDCSCANGIRAHKRCDESSSCGELINTLHFYSAFIFWE